MKRLLALGLLVFAAPLAQAQNLLTNGGFESGTGLIYFDGFSPAVSDDEPAWELFLGSADGSYVQTAPDATAGAGTRDLDMGVGPGGGGVKTAVGSRPAVTPLQSYRASVSTDNYFSPVNPTLAIDWFNAGGSLISSTSAVLGDPNGALVFEPYTQRFSVFGAAPATAAKAGVRFDGGNAGYAGLTADNFFLGSVPEPSAIALATLAVLPALGAARRRRLAAR